MLGKVYTEILESGDTRSARALLEAGSPRLGALLYALVPSTAQELASYTVYRWECAVRASVVMGFVGAGGLGQLMDQSMKMLNGGEASTILLTFLALVIVADALSAVIRRSCHEPPGRSKANTAARSAKVSDEHDRRDAPPTACRVLGLHRPRARRRRGGDGELRLPRRRLSPALQQRVDAADGEVRRRVLPARPRAGVRRQGGLGRAADLRGGGDRHPARRPLRRRARPARGGTLRARAARSRHGSSSTSCAAFPSSSGRR